MGWTGRPTLAAACLALGCSAPPENTDDVYPRNCGVEGPVDLFEYPADALAFFPALEADTHYLVGYFIDETTWHWWSVERCGRERHPLDVVHDGSGVDVAGRWMLECDSSDEKVWVHDPTGLAPARVLFGSAAGCRVVAVGDGLAAQEATGGNVWFSPDPLDADRSPILVTDRALPADPDDTCIGVIACELPEYSDGIRAADGELIVMLEDESLLSFAVASATTKVVHDGPVQRAAFLGPDARYLAIDPMGAPTFVLDRRSGATFEFCCLGGFDPMKVLGDWLVRGSSGPPTIPEPETWTVLTARNLESHETVEVTGAAGWYPRARLTDTTLLIDVSANRRKLRTIYWPSSGWQQAIDLPGDRVWPSGLGEGAFAYVSNDEVPGLYFLPNADEPVQELLTDEEVFFVTSADRVVFSPAHERGEPVPLRVRMPDGGIVQLDGATKEVLNTRSSCSWPHDTDEVLYVTETDTGTWLRRTVLP